MKWVQGEKKEHKITKQKQEEERKKNQGPTKHKVFALGI